MRSALRLLHFAVVVGQATAPGCPAGFTRMASATNWTFCEQLAIQQPRPQHSEVRFIKPGGSLLLSLQKTAQPVYVNESGCYLGLGKAKALGSGADLLGSMLLASAGPEDLTLREVAAVVPPIATVKNAQTFVGSRSATVDVVFDVLSADVNSMGYPTMDQSASFRGMKQAIYHADLDLRATREGLWGKHLPAVSFYYQLVDGGSVEFSAVPVADMQGNREQDAFFRLMKLDASGQLKEVRYFDTYDVRPNWDFGGQGHPPGSPSATSFYQALLDLDSYWEAEFAAEGVLSLDLPRRAHDTDGSLLRDQTMHCVVRDMITRMDTVWPKYGVLPNPYGLPTSNGFQDTFCVSLAMALEMGAFKYAQGIAHDYLQYYLKPDGTLRYRGPEIALNGRMLTLIGQYYFFTGDSGLLLQHHDKIVELVGTLRQLRDRALR